MVEQNADSIAFTTTVLIYDYWYYTDIRPLRMTKYFSTSTVVFRQLPNRWLLFDNSMQLLKHSQTYGSNIDK